MQGLAEAACSAPHPCSLTHSLSSSHTSSHCAPPTSSGIHSEKDTCQVAACLDYTAKERESEKPKRARTREEIKREREGTKVRGKSLGRGVIKRAMEIKPESDEKIYIHKLLGWVNMPGTCGTHSHTLLKVIIASAQARTNTDPHTYSLPQRLPRIRSSIQVSSRKTQGHVNQSLCIHIAAHSVRNL